MQNARTIIDFKIIWKKINHSLTEKEEMLLAKWLSEDPSHQQYFDKARHYYLQDSAFSEVRSESGKVWVTLNIKASQKSHLNLKWMVSLAAAVIVVGLCITFLIPSHKIRQDTATIDKAGLIKPGIKQAMLTLADGSVRNLSASGNLILAEGGAELKSEGMKLQYTEKKVVGKEIKYNTLSIPRGGEFFLQLTDGTKVWLNSETELRYPVQFMGKERRVELTGEAYFEVAKNEKIPFIVESGEQTVKVLGTEFNISCYKDNPMIYTTLVNGHVEVSIKNMPEINQTLSPNEQSSINKLEVQITKRIIDPYSYVAWKNGRFVFQDQNLEEIMKTLSKWYNVEVVFANQELRNYRFTGDLQRYADFGEVLGKIGKTNEVNFTIENKLITIR